MAEVNWSLIGKHNAYNAAAAVASAVAGVGIPLEQACSCLSSFINVKRRLECILDIDNVKVYDDFAHHPTAIQCTLSALRAKVGEARIFAVLEPRSHTMKTGVHRHTLAKSLSGADHVFLYQSLAVQWDMQTSMAESGLDCSVFATIGDIIKALINELDTGDHIVIMSNGSFDGIYQKLAEVLRAR